MENSTKKKKNQNQEQNPHNGILKKQTGNPTKSMPYHTNLWIKYKSRRTHNTFY